MGLFDLVKNVPIVGGLVNGLGGEINKKEGGTDAGNLFKTNIGGNQAALGAAQEGIQGLNSGQAGENVQNNPLLSSMFGQGGAMSQAMQDYGQERNQGFNLTPEDHTAYGQVSGDIARQFGQSDQSLAQALSDRGLSSSGVAGAAFSNSQGNKMEQLAKAQQSIAQARYQTNLQKMSQTQNFLSSMGNQANQALGQEENLGLEKNRNMFDMASSNLKNAQGQSNEQLQQQQDTSHPSDFMAGLTGAMQLGSGIGKMSSGMSGGGAGSKGGMS